MLRLSAPILSQPELALHRGRLVPNPALQAAAGLDGESYFELERDSHLAEHATNLWS